MRDLARILLPVDFSERSAGAVRYGRALAAHFHSELILIHVLTPPQFEFGALDIGGTMLAELYRNRSAQATSEIHGFLASELEGVKVRRLIVEGDPAAKIVECAHEQPDQTVVVIPTHGYGPYRRFILGSNAAKVLHDADCPVWTGIHLEQTAAEATLPFRRILCAVDLGPQSSRTLVWAARLAAEFDARLDVLHATGAAPSPADDSDAAWQVSLCESARRELQRVCEFAGVSADVTVESGEPASVICSAAERLAADVVVIGRGSAAGVFGRLRTNAYAIIRQSPSPVVSV